MKAVIALATTFALQLGFAAVRDTPERDTPSLAPRNDPHSAGSGCRRDCEHLGPCDLGRTLAHRRLRGIAHRQGRRRQAPFMSASYAEVLTDPKQSPYNFVVAP